ncbi:sensor domain-containing diguanylate cyclase [Duganella qianjiadongensis]|uniref:Diguanylate cyclase n=1 Tax=Duganella qianjiadongensis TaxID=2692176 RepID=A0ABW9VT11_9BURK|nr:sensor domain-containing diguanylate cyclase [Duganella qianjiadongensis]MYM42200.1 diguanylate cyclase [Duganella qianjiadongensis]
MFGDQRFPLKSLDASVFLAIINMQTEIARCGMDLGEVLTLVCERVQEITSASAAIIEIADGTQMVYRAASGTATGLLGLRMAIEGSMSGLCVRTGKAMVCVDSETDDRVDRISCQVAGVRSMVVVPLVHNMHSVGALKIASGKPNFFTAKEVTILELVSGVIAAAMYYSTRYSSDELYHSATHDSLTNLPNRSFFYERLRFSIAQSFRHKTKFALLSLDMDGLKQINDGCGHRCGDAAIVEFANRLAGAIRETDFVGRLGGDEFSVILSGVENIESVKFKVASLNNVIERPFSFEGLDLLIRASTGIAIYPDDSTELIGLIEKSDEDMYKTKRNRKEQV